MSTSRKLISAFTCLALACSCAGALADPGNGNGNGGGQGGPPNSQGHGNQDNRGHQDDHGKQGGPGGHDANDGHPGKGDRGHGPSVNYESARGIVGGHRDYWRPGPALPPGIQKNLARGKPLPPGIGQRLDSRLEGRLPRYEGYEWRQAGTELVLVSLASGLIYEIVNGAFN